MRGHLTQSHAPGPSTASEPAGSVQVPGTAVRLPFSVSSELHAPSGSTAKATFGTVSLTGSRSTLVRSLLHLQRTRGNHYVQRILALAREGDSESEVTPEVESAIESARGGGQQLDGGTQRKMESAFGSDFSSVRIHTGTQAHSLNRAVNAVAFTVGQNIFFREGAFNPGSSGGRELLAHELTHTVQQSRNGIRPKRVVGEANHSFEQEAARATDAGDTAASRLSGARSFSSVQSQCACGAHGASAGECSECRKKNEVMAIADSPGLARAVQRAEPAAIASLRVNEYSGSPSTVIFRSESVHPEEQYCEDVSKDSNAPCNSIIDCIEDLIEELAGRFSDFENKGGDPGHAQRIRIVQGILQTLMTMARLACKNGEYDEELEKEVEKWANKRVIEEAPVEQDESVWDKLRKYLPEILVGALIALGVAAIAAAIVACFASGACEFALVLAGLSVVLALGIRAALESAGVRDTPSSDFGSALSEAQTQAAQPAGPSEEEPNAQGLVSQQTAPPEEQQAEENAA